MAVINIEPDLFTKNEKEYLKSKRAAQDAKRGDDLNSLTINMQQTQIACTKYNYSLDKSVQNFTCFEASMTLDKKSRFIIQIYKPIERTNIFGMNDESDEESLEDIDIKDENN